MKTEPIKLIISLLLIVFISPAYAGYYNQMIDVSVISDNAGKLNKYPVSSGHQKEKAYIAAKKGHSYGIKIRNKTANRIGVVVAVDGRNIISGKKSHLNKNERMYVLGPFESATYNGWRTGRNQVNRFYFTQAKHSYAAAWGDRSAMGVIAIAAFKEKRHVYRKPNKQATPNKPRNRRHAKKPGTGFGEEEYSPVVKVHFEPKYQASFKSFLKYEWKHVLCKKGIINCHNHQTSDEDENRFWVDEDDYAPYPTHWKGWRKSSIFSHRKHH